MFDKIQSSFSALLSVFKLRNKNKKKQDQEHEQEDGEEQYDEYEEDIPSLEDEDKAMGSIKDGDHGNIKGFNRNLIKGVAVGILIIFGCALMYVVQDSSKEAKAPQDKGRAEEAVNVKDKNKNGFPESYSDLAKYNKTQAAAQPQQTAAGEQRPQQLTQVRQQTAAPAIPQQRPQSVASVPYVNQPSQFTPYMLPSQQQAQNNAKKEEEEAKKQEEKSLLDRLKSAISFGIGDSSAQQASAETAAKPASSGAMPVGTMSMTSYSNMTILPGTLIPASLISGINSDVPGQITAQVQSNVYDSITGSILLIPAGSRLLGSYGNDVRNGRVGIGFSTLITPDGKCFSIGNSMMAIDKQGYSGVKGHVNDHSNKVLGNGFLTSTFAALTSLAAGNVSNSSGTYTAGQLAAQGAVSNMINTASSIFQKAANMQSTTTVEPGYSFYIYVTSPLDFAGADI